MLPKFVVKFIIYILYKIWNSQTDLSYSQLFACRILMIQLLRNTK